MGQEDPKKRDIIIDTRHSVLDGRLILIMVVGGVWSSLLESSTKEFPGHVLTLCVYMKLDVC